MKLTEWESSCVWERDTRLNDKYIETEEKILLILKQSSQEFLPICKHVSKLTKKISSFFASAWELQLFCVKILPLLLMPTHLLLMRQIKCYDFPSFFQVLRLDNFFPLFFSSLTLKATRAILVTQIDICKKQKVIVEKKFPRLLEDKMSHKSLYVHYFNFDKTDALLRSKSGVSSTRLAWCDYAARIVIENPHQYVEFVLVCGN